MGLPDVVFLPFRAARQVAGAVAGAVSPAPSAGELVVVGGMPEGVPPAALKPEPRFPAPTGTSDARRHRPHRPPAGRASGGPTEGSSRRYGTWGVTSGDTMLT